MVFFVTIREYQTPYRPSYMDIFTIQCQCAVKTGLEVIKVEFILKLKIKRNDWLLVDTCTQAANHCALF